MRKVFALRLSSSTDDRITVGYVRRAHGLRGEVLVRPVTDHPERFAAGAAVATDETPSRVIAIDYVRHHNAGIIVKFAQVADRNAAEAMRGVSFSIDRSQRRSLEDGEYWPDDLKGATAVDVAGIPLGLVTDVVLGDAQDRLVVTTPGDVIVEIPFVDALVGDVDVTSGRVVILQPETFFES